MSDYTKRFVAYVVMIVGVAWAIAFAVVFTRDTDSSLDENYTYCIEHGGTYTKNDVDYSCTLPNTVRP